MLLGVDVGGTFTDAVLFDGSEIHTAKAPTTPGDESEGVLAAIAAVRRKADAPPGEIDRFVHGMTVGTNALLEERGARVVLITTRGFEDVLEIGRQDRPDLYRLCTPKPVPLVAAGDRVGAGGRMGPDGEVEDLDEHEIDRIAAAVDDLGPDSVAVCLLHSYVDPSHEQRIAAAVRDRLGDVHVSASHEVLPRFREYERTSTTVVDAYLSPLLGRYLGRLAEEAAAADLPEPEIMRSSGGVSPWGEAARQGAWCVLSGPAGGAVGAGMVARVSDSGNVVGLDMGGTSCDVCTIESGRAQITESREIGGRTIQLPMVDVHTVGAGGGSIGWVDHGGALRVGPRSAGADPGPACYGRGGTDATVTDANLVLGRLAPGASFAGEVELDPEAASRVIASLGQRAGLGELETAAGIVRLANAEMARALRVVTVNRGIDPREFALMPFGGAGPMHAADLAAALGMTRMICPRVGGVLSALGLLASPRRRDTARTVMMADADVTDESIAAAVSELRATIEEGMESANETVSYELRYQGQSFELAVEPDGEPSRDELIRAFAEAHERRYGFDVPGAAVELVAIRLALETDPPELRLTAATGGMEESSRRIWLDDEWQDVFVGRGEPRSGTRVDGPAVLELPESTLLLPSGWSARVDEHGSVVAEKAAG